MRSMYYILFIYTVGNLRIPFLELVHHKPDGMIVTYIPKVTEHTVCTCFSCPSLVLVVCSSVPPSMY